MEAKMKLTKLISYIGFLLFLTVKVQATLAFDDGVLVRSFLKDKNCTTTQTDIAESLYVSQPTVSRFLNDKNSPKIIPNFCDFAKQDFKLKPSCLKQYKRFYKNVGIRHGKTPIFISYRHDCEGKGAIFDHHAVQAITSYPTTILSSENIDMKQPNELGYTFALKNKPECRNFLSEDAGLLVITGSHKAEEGKDRYVKRIEFENKQIKKALLEGRPILAICAGSWVLWNNFIDSDSTNINTHLKKVQGHNNRRGMIRLNIEGKVIFNEQIHDIDINKNSLLFSFINYPQSNVIEKISVNSLHSVAVNENTKPNFINIAAQSTKDSVIEAFETKFGAPVIGIQWHPEAYTNNSTPCLSMDIKKCHQNIIQSMAQAGDAFSKKQNVLKELKTWIALTKSKS
jgi:gamma-glutamyl-gamma-aminobutyrate hydrolase PuuD